MDNKGNIIAGPIDFYQKPKEQHGNGYCGMATTYKMKSIKVKEYKRKIILPE